MNTIRRKRWPRAGRFFGAVTRIENLVLITIVVILAAILAAILAGMLVPALA